MNTFEAIIHAIVLTIYSILQWFAKVGTAIWFTIFKSHLEKEYVPEGEVWNAWHLFGYEKEIDTLPAGSVCYPKRYSFISKLKTGEHTYQYNGHGEDVTLEFTFTLKITDAVTIAKRDIAQTMEGTRTWVGQNMSAHISHILNDKLPFVAMSYATGGENGIPATRRAGIRVSPFDCLKMLENNKQTIIQEALNSYARNNGGITITDFDYSIISTAEDFSHFTFE